MTCYSPYNLYRLFLHNGPRLFLYYWRRRSSFTWVIIRENKKEAILVVRYEQRWLTIYSTRSYLLYGYFCLKRFSGQNRLKFCYMLHLLAVYKFKSQISHLLALNIEKSEINISLTMFI